MSPELPKLLKDRARMLKEAREFFFQRNVLEVDCGALVKRAPIDANIDVISAAVTTKETGYLHTSPEYAMKRLLSHGAPDIFFLGHVYRKGEIGRLHNPEFTMAEWYRIGFTFQQMIDETCEFLFLFLGSLPVKTISYRQAFAIYAGIDYSKDSLLPLLPSHASSWSRPESLHYILTHYVEPKLGQNELTVLIDYPPNEAALAQVTQKNGETVAERFEIYYQGVELSNGYHELSDAIELSRRFEQENEEREKRGEEKYLLDEEFLSSLKQGFPDCCGVSVGFDRAFMLMQKGKSLSQIFPFPWEPTMA